MASKHYTIEREGQIDFFNNYHIPYEDDDVLINNTDGVYNGNILEFKLNITNPNKVLFQAIKYLSRMRIKGDSVPATILCIDLNDTKIYKYSSKNYKDAIHKVYVGAASKYNDDFAAQDPDEIIDYSEMVGSAKVAQLLKPKKNIADEFMPIDIDENCIVGWGERYYREIPKASKGDFLGTEDGTAVTVVGEIREPKHFKGLINPYTGKTNEKFKYLMGVLNSRLQKKDLGAFYTPMEYAKKAAELVKLAVDRVPEGNDYIILDRCAGTGNLEEALIGIKDKNGDELIEHCVVSTYEYYEYKVLSERIGHLVRNIIPPTEADVVYANGTVSNADAMSEDYINNLIIKSYVDDPNCTIILYENPPYRDASAANKTNDENSQTTRSYVSEQMSLVKNNFVNKNVSTVRDLTNQFVWSGFNYYLKEGEAYILFSPPKWWKSCGIVDCSCEQGYLFNRKFFDATVSPIMCCYWVKKSDPAETISLTSIADIKDLDKTEVVAVNKCYNTFSTWFNKNLPGDKGVFCESSGYEAHGRKCDGVALYHENIIGYLTPKGFTLDANNNNLVRATHYNNRGTYVTRENHLYMCPLFVAKEYPRDKYYEKGESCIYFTTSDGGDAYTKDKDFLKSCLIYTCLSNQNKCLSFVGSDGRWYKNELCFDNDTLASRELLSMRLDTEEVALLDIWHKIIDEARNTGKCNPDMPYGVYQITKEINTSHKVKVGKEEKTVYDYPILNGDLETLRVLLKKYYQTHITEKMFKYELLK